MGAKRMADAVWINWMFYRLNPARKLVLHLRYTGELYGLCQELYQGGGKI